MSSRTPSKVHQDDRGLAAVRRVRVARENDSRVGLQRALTESRLAHTAAERAQQRLAGATPFGTGLLADFQLHRTMLAAMATDQVAAEQDAAAGARIAEEARLRWVADRTAVRVADQLLERRRAARAEDRARREAAELDDLAATAWLRRTTETEDAR
jgi:flagellar biosynthesis chaperone FliJ